MNNLQIFSYDNHKVRTIEENGKILFCGSDVARILGYVKPQNAIAKHCRGALKRGTLTAGGKQEMIFIPEGDLYRLISHSKLPTAEKFEYWVFDKVLPTIRKTGGYVSNALGALFFCIFLKGKSLKKGIDLCRAKGYNTYVGQK